MAHSYSSKTYLCELPVKGEASQTFGSQRSKIETKGKNKKKKKSHLLPYLLNMITRIFNTNESSDKNWEWHMFLWS